MSSALDPTLLLYMQRRACGVTLVKHHMNPSESQWMAVAGSSQFYADSPQAAMDLLIVDLGRWLADNPIPAQAKASEAAESTDTATETDGTPAELPVESNVPIENAEVGSDPTLPTAEKA